MVYELKDLVFYAILKGGIALETVYDKYISWTSISTILASFKHGAFTWRYRFSIYTSRAIGSPEIGVEK